MVALKLLRPSRTRHKSPTRSSRRNASVGRVSTTLSTTTGSDAWFMIAAGCGRPEDLDGDFVPDECEPCPEDVIGQFARVDAFDLEQVLLAWGSDAPRLDLDGDGVVDGVDLAAVLLAWGSCGG